MPKSSAKHATPIPANDADNVVRLWQWRFERAAQERKARFADAWMPPERALLMAILGALAESDRKRDKRTLSAIRWKLEALSHFYADCDGFDRARSILSASIPFFRE